MRAYNKYAAINFEAILEWEWVDEKDKIITSIFIKMDN